MRRREAEGRGHSQNSASEKNTACGCAVHTRHLTETIMLALPFDLPYKLLQGDPAVQVPQILTK